MLKQSPFAEALKTDEAVLSHAQKVIIKNIREDKIQSAGNLLYTFPLAKNDKIQREAREAALEKLSRAGGQYSVPNVAFLEDKFDLKSDPEYLKGLMSIVTQMVREDRLIDADSFLWSYAVPFDDEKLQTWAKIGVNKMLLEGDIPKGFFARFPELVRDEEIRGSMKLLARKCLTQDRGGDFQRLQEYLPDLAEDPDVRRALKLDRARIIADKPEKRNYPSTTHRVLSYSEEQEARLMALLDTLVKGIPAGEPTPEREDSKIIDYIQQTQNHSDNPRVEQAVKIGIGNSKPEASLGILVGLIKMFPDVVKEPKVGESVKAIVAHSLKTPEEKYRRQDLYIKEREIQKYRSCLNLLGYFPDLLQDAEVQEILKAG
ncbi:MAG: hypothetical protein WCW34_00265 [Patescibacteria group bacterium]